jgi:type I site-specific restriction-modification system R (restriction) subunit
MINAQEPLYGTTDHIDDQGTRRRRYGVLCRTLRVGEAIARYHSNAITTAEVIQELINLAKEVREALRRGEEEGLSLDEIAFYDALAENNSAVEVMGNDALKVIAHELLTNLKGSVTVDWSHRESARAKMRVSPAHCEGTSRLMNKLF